jgi:hypothetical protein
MFSDLPGVECIVDDILVWGENDEQHDCRVRQMFQRCRQMNFKLNKSKFELLLQCIQMRVGAWLKANVSGFKEKIMCVELPTKNV